MKKAESAQEIWDVLVAADASGNMLTTQEIIDATGLTRSQFHYAWAEVKDAVLEYYGRTLGMVWSGWPVQCYWKLPQDYGDEATQGTTHHRINFRLRSQMTALKRTLRECAASEKQYTTRETRRLKRDVERVVEDLADVLA